MRRIADEVGQQLAADPEFGGRIVAPPRYLRVDSIDANGVGVQVNGTVRPGSQWEIAGVLRARLLEGVVSAPGAPPVARVMLGLAGPNPFEASTRVEFRLPDARAVQLRVAGVDGRTVRTLERGFLGAGLHVRSWDGRDDAGDRVAPGIYVITLAAGPETRAVRVARIR